MKITHNGDEWHGTFGLTLATMVDDLLSDGEPIVATVTYEAEGVTITDGLTITTHEPGHLVTAEEDGSCGRVETDAILSLEVH